MVSVKILFIILNHCQSLSEGIIFVKKNAEVGPSLSFSTYFLSVCLNYNF